MIVLEMIGVLVEGSDRKENQNLPFSCPPRRDEGEFPWLCHTISHPTLPIQSIPGTLQPKTYDTRAFARRFSLFSRAINI